MEFASLPANVVLLCYFMCFSAPCSCHRLDRIPIRWNCYDDPLYYPLRLYSSLWMYFRPYPPTRCLRNIAYEYDEYSSGQSELPYGCHEPNGLWQQHSIWSCLWQMLQSHTPKHLFVRSTVFSGRGEERGREGDGPMSLEHHGMV